MTPYERGFNAFYSYTKGNPYKDNHYSYREWERGYNSAYFFNLNKVKERESERKQA
jgi:hypothetical protein